MFILRNISHSLTYLLPGHEELENKSNGHSNFCICTLVCYFLPSLLFDLYGGTLSV